MKTCPQCGAHAHPEHDKTNHQAAHMAAHGISRGHPSHALIAGGIAAANWALRQAGIINRSYRCSKCSHRFDA